MSHFASSKKLEQSIRAHTKDTRCFKFLKSNIMIRMRLAIVVKLACTIFVVVDVSAYDVKIPTQQKVPFSPQISAANSHICHHAALRHMTVGNVTPCFISQCYLF